MDRSRNVLIIQNTDASFLLKLKRQLTCVGAVVLVCVDVRRAQERFESYVDRVLMVVTSDEEWYKKLKEQYPEVEVVLFKEASASHMQELAAHLLDERTP